MRSLRRFMAGISLAAAAAAWTSTAVAEQTIHLKVAGNLAATGLMLQQVEKPFFENLPEKTGLPITVDYKPMDVIGIKDVEGLRILKSGLFDIVTLRVIQVSRDAPSLIGLDIAGLNTDYDRARKVTDAYRGVFDETLHDRFNSKLLGLWPFGPQVLFCNAPISGLEDIRGKKVRVGGKTLADLVESLGAIPVTLSFGEAQQALARGVTDCAITGPSSANSAGWPEVTTHIMPIGFFVAHNAYAINLDTWNKFTPEQQKTLEQAFATMEDEAWAHSEKLYLDAIRCTVGEEPCETVTRYDLEEVEVTDADRQRIQKALKEVSFPAWAEQCDSHTPGCSDRWKETVGPLTDIQ